MRELVRYGTLVRSWYAIMTDTHYRKFTMCDMLYFHLVDDETICEPVLPDFIARLRLIQHQISDYYLSFADDTSIYVSRDVNHIVSITFVAAIVTSHHLLRCD